MGPSTNCGAGAAAVPSVPHSLTHGRTWPLVALASWRRPQTHAPRIQESSRGVHPTRKRPLLRVLVELDRVDCKQVPIFDDSNPAGLRH